MATVSTDARRRTHFILRRSREMKVDKTSDADVRLEFHPVQVTGDEKRPNCFPLSLIRFIPRTPREMKIVVKKTLSGIAGTLLAMLIVISAFTPAGLYVVAALFGLAAGVPPVLFAYLGIKEAAMLASCFSFVAMLVSALGMMAAGAAGIDWHPFFVTALVIAACFFALSRVQKKGIACRDVPEGDNGEPASSQQ